MIKKFLTEKISLDKEVKSWLYAFFEKIFILVKIQSSKETVGAQAGERRTV
jgi:hypothetical protein